MADKPKDIRAEAMAHMRAARTNLGEDTIQQMAASIKKMEQQNAAMEAARKRLATEADAELVAFELLSMLKDKGEN